MMDFEITELDIETLFYERTYDIKAFMEQFDIK